VSPVIGALPVVAVVAVVVVVIVLAWTFLGRSGSGPTNTPVASGSPAAPDPSQQRPSAQPAPSDTVSTPPATDGSTPSATEGTEVDKAAPITVMNSSGIGGLAKRAATRLQSRGWTIDGIPGNVTPPRSTTVYYATAAQKATAQAVLKDLGGRYRMKLSPAEAAAGITVVLGSDYRA
jgi:cytoskeletal protein RodZ